MSEEDGSKWVIDMLFSSEAYARRMKQLTEGACSAYRQDLQAMAKHERFTEIWRLQVEYCREGREERPQSPLAPMHVEILAVDALFTFLARMRER